MVFARNPVGAHIVRPLFVILSPAGAGGLTRPCPAAASRPRLYVIPFPLSQGRPHVAVPAEQQGGPVVRLPPHILCVPLPLLHLFIHLIEKNISLSQGETGQPLLLNRKMGPAGRQVPFLFYYNKRRGKGITPSAPPPTRRIWPPFHRTRRGWLHWPGYRP